jgi:hypothetical protein
MWMMVSVNLLSSWTLSPETTPPSSGQNLVIRYLPLRNWVSPG